MIRALVCTACCALAAALPVRGQDALLLPPVPGTDRSEVLDGLDAAPAPVPAAADTADDEKISLEDVVIYGSGTFKTAPGNKLPPAAAGVLIPRSAPRSRLRDNLYRQLPHVENKFLLSRDWALRDRFLSKFSLSYGAWNTLDGNLLLGRQNFLLRTDQLVDLFFNVLLKQSLGHESDGSYFSRSTGLKGTCLYEIERNVETKTYIDYRSGLYHQANALGTRTTGRNELGFIVNAYRGDLAAANLHLAHTAGSLADTAAADYQSFDARGRATLKRYGLLMKAEGAYTGYGVRPAGAGSPSDTGDVAKNKTNLYKLALREDGWQVPLAGYDLVLDGGLALWLYDNYLYGKRLRPVLHPAFTLHWAALPDADLYLRHAPDMAFTPLDALTERNRYIKKNSQIVPRDTYVRLLAGGEYRHPAGVTLNLEGGYARTRRYLRYQFDPADSLYMVMAGPDALYPDAQVQTGIFSLGLRTREWHRTLLEAYLDVKASSFVNDDAPVPYAPAYKFGVTVAGTWFYGVEQRWYVYHEAERHWGVAAGQTLPAYTMLDVSLTKNISEELKLYLLSSVSLDGRYRTWYGYTDPPVRIDAGLRMRW